MSEIDWAKWRPGVGGPMPRTGPPPVKFPFLSGGQGPMDSIGNSLYDKFINPIFDEIGNPTPDFSDVQSGASTIDPFADVQSGASTAVPSGMPPRQVENPGATSLLKENSVRDAPVSNFDLSAFRKNKIVEGLNSGELQSNNLRGPAMKAFLDNLDSAPDRSNYKPSFGRKLVAGALSLRPEGLRGSQAFLDEPFNEAMQDWSNKSQRLHQGAELEEKSSIALNKYLVEVGNLIGRQHNWDSLAGHRSNMEDQYSNRTTGMVNAANRRANAAEETNRQMSPVRQALTKLYGSRQAHLDRPPGPARLNPVNADKLAVTQVMRNPSYSMLFQPDDNGNINIIAPTDSKLMPLWHAFVRDVDAARAGLLQGQPGYVMPPFNPDDQSQDDEEYDQEDQ